MADGPLLLSQCRLHSLLTVADRAQKGARKIWRQRTPPPGVAMPGMPPRTNESATARRRGPTRALRPSTVL
eukprot:2365345-Pyramimonas_sp.AAC.1